MRNLVSLFKHYRHGRGLSRPDWAGILALALVLAGGGASPSGRQPSARESLPAPPQPLELPGTPEPELAALFLPAGAPPGAFRLHVVDLTLEPAIDLVRAALAPGARIDEPSGAWRIQPTDPLQAFGETRRYNRQRLARLYGGSPARVARAPIERDGRVVASVTLISPYPDARLSRLMPGTLVILFDVAAARAGRR